MARTAIPTVQNLLTFSEQFDNAAWVPSGNAAATANTVANPIDGTVNADTITASAGGTFHLTGYSGAGTFSSIAGVNTGPYTFSIHVKKNTNDWIAIMVPSNLSSSNAVYFNLATGTWGTTATNATTLKITRNIENDFGNGWYRLSVTIPTIPAYGGSTTGFGIFLANADLGNSFSAAGTESVYVFGAQLNNGNRAAAYTTVAGSNVNTGGIRNAVANRVSTSSRSSILTGRLPLNNTFAGISGAVLLLDPSFGVGKSGTAVGGWSDRASGIVFNPRTTTPTWSATGINSAPAISFDGSANALIGNIDVSAIVGLKNWTLYLVIKPASLTGARVLLSVGGNAGGFGAGFNLGSTGKREFEYKTIGFPDFGTATTNAEIWCMTRDNQATPVSSASVNGSTVSVGSPTGTVAAFSASSMSIAANYTAGFFSGFLGHIMLFPTSHDASTQSTVVTGLNTIYGIF